MTTERRKALLMMSVTFAIGMLIGVLGTGFFARHFYHGRWSMDKREISGKPRGNFATKIFQVVKADSAQAKAMKPIIEGTMAKIDSVQGAGERDARALMEGLKQKLVPILKPEQIERLEKFASRKQKSRDERNNRGKGRPHD